MRRPLHETGLTSKAPTPHGGDAAEKACEWQMSVIRDSPEQRFFGKYRRRGVTTSVCFVWITEGLGSGFGPVLDPVKQGSEIPRFYGPFLNRFFGSKTSAFLN